MGRRARIHGFVGSCVRKVSETKSKFFPTEYVLPKFPFEVTGTLLQNVTTVLNDRAPPEKGRC